MTPSRRRTEKRAPLSLGWREWVMLPDLGVRTIKAKLDTGARTSSLHAFGLKRFTRDGQPMVRFEIHPVQRSRAARIHVEAPVVTEREVRNSGGQREVRPVIETTLDLAGERWSIELTLTRRDQMGFRMLLGRRALRGRILVDPGRSFVAGRAKEGTRVAVHRRGARRPPSDEEE